MIVLGIIAIIAGVAGIIGSIVPALPGPPVSWVGMLLAFFAKGLDKTGEPMSLTFLLIWCGIMIVVTILDYVVPAKFTRVSGGTKAASRGAMIGLLLGMFLTPIGMIVGSLIGAFAGELIFAGKGFTGSVKSSLGAFAGFLFGTGLKLISSGIMMYHIIIYAF